MGLFDSLGNKGNFTATMNPQQILGQLKSNPQTTLKQAGFSIPDGMNNPGQIINYLLQSGQVNNSRIQMANNMLNMFNRK